MKGIKTLVVFLLVLISLLSANLSLADTEFQVNKVEINGLELTDGETLDVERGETVEIIVVIKALTNLNDVYAEVEIRGYEYGDIRDRTDLFDLEEGVSYKKTLSLEIPEDIDASKEYTIRLSVSNGNSEEESLEFNLNVDEKRHLVNVYDIVFRETQVEAGKNFFARVRVENMGSKREDDVKVTVSIPALKVSGSTYVDTLATEQSEENDAYYRKHNSESTNEIFFRIPANAEPGKYDVVTRIEYNRGHDVDTQVDTIEVLAQAGQKLRSIVNVDTTYRALAQGETATYKVMFANMGDKQETYFVEVLGVENWGSATISPEVVTIQPDSIKEVFVKVTADKDSELGKHKFSLMLSSSDFSFNEEVNLEAEVTGKTNLDLRKTLEIGLVVLLAFLVLLFLVLAFKKLMGNDDLDEPLEDQNYY